MPRIDVRIEKLECQAHHDDVVYLFPLPIETDADRIRRHGRDPDDAGVRFVIVRWACDSGARV